MKDQPRQLVPHNGFWRLIERQGEGQNDKITDTGIPITVPRKQAIAQLKGGVK